MRRVSPAGVMITQGPGDWQVIQRRPDCRADISLAGTWIDPQNRLALVEVRVVNCRTQIAAAMHLDWHDAETSPNRTWRHVLKDIPMGGPYRLETRLRVEGDSWRLNGDSVHQLGVGDLWVIAGDDNAVGFSTGEVEDIPDDGVRLFRHNCRWDMADHPLHDSTGSGNRNCFSDGKTGHSPWLAFGRTLERGLGIPIGLIPAGLAGGRVRQWTRDAEAAPGLEILREMALLATSLRNYSEFNPLDGGPSFTPRPGGRPGPVAGVLWYQGNADAACAEAAENYGIAFRNAAASIREELASPELPFITCQLNRVWGVFNRREWEWWSLVREAQRAASHDLPGVAVVCTLDAGLSDGVRNSVSGNLLIGARAARAALGMVYGKPIPWKGPDFHSAFFDNNDRSAVIVEFSHVSGELRPAGREITCFAFADQNGGAPARRIDNAGPNRLRVVLNRELGENPIASYCPGFNPEAGFFDDNHCPPLAFHRVAITF